MTENIKRTSLVVSRPLSKYFEFGASLLSYLIIVLSSSLIVHFSHVRGNPTPLIILYYISLSINIIQAIGIVSKFITYKLGFFNKKFDFVNKVLSYIWITVLLLQFIMSSVLFEAFRIDMLLIMITQLIAVLLLTKYASKIDYKINRKFNKHIQKKGENPLDVRVIQKREYKKAINYLLVILMILTIQISVLLFPKIPPRIDDIFSQTRTLKYTYIESKGGYYVTDVYSGLSDSIIIPLSYNNQPVVGISSRAISDDGIIKNIQIGEYNSNGILMSNVTTLSSDSISLDTLVSIDLPSSIKTLAYRAIAGDNIESINYYSSHTFSLKSFDTPKLSIINLKNETTPVNVDYNLNMDISVNVPLALYNVYRESFFEYRKIFQSNDMHDVIIVDFETGTNTYLESQILDLNEGLARLNIENLKNVGDETSTYIHDTVLYNENNYATEGFISKPGYVFRGWYRDLSWNIESVFNGDDFVYFDSNTTLYARWEEIKTIELDWSNYFPYNESTTTISYIESDDLNESIMLPKLISSGGDIDRKGFESLTWKYNDIIIEKTADLYQLDIESNVTQLKAVWKLEAPSITYSTQVDSVKYNGSNLSFTFDEDQLINFTAAFSNDSEDVWIRYNWKKIISDQQEILLYSSVTTNSDIFNYNFRNYLDSGQYAIEVIATATTGETSISIQRYSININKKNLDISTYDIPVPVTYIYNGFEQRYDYNYPLPSDIQVSVYYELEHDNQSTLGPVDARSVAYNIQYVFAKVGSEESNYHTASAYSSILITPKLVTANWTQTDLSWSPDNSVIYDGYEHLLTPTVIGLCANDEASFILSNNPKIDAGNYVSTIVGVNNLNYGIDFNVIESTKNWSIKPMQITSTWGSTSKTYIGTNQVFNLYLVGLASRDISVITNNDFSINTSFEEVMFDPILKSLTFSAKNAGQYNVSVVSFNNSNYTFDEINNDLIITPTALSVNWTGLQKTYNGTSQEARLILTGFRNNDEQSYDDTNISQLLNINTDSDEYKVNSLNDQGTLEILFTSTHADEYNILATDILGDNYSINTVSNVFTIAPRKLTGSWVHSNLEYNGLNQAVSITFQDIYPEDLNNMSAVDFNSSYDALFYDAEKGLTSLTLRYYAKDAGVYSINILSFDLNKYNGNYSFDPISYDFEIKPRPVVLTWNSDSFVYNNSLHQVTAQIMNIYGSDIVNISYNGNSALNVGQYTATVSIDNPNYLASSQNNHTWEITKKDINVEIIKDNFTYNGTYQFLEIKYSGFELNDLISLETADFTFTFNLPTLINYNSLSIVNGDAIARFTAIDANDYIITLASNSSKLDNYNILTTTSNIGIATLPITYDWVYTNDFVYNSLSHAVSINITNARTREDTGLLDLIIPSYSNNSKIDAGSYIATINELSNPNYSLEIDQDHSFEWQISPRVLDIEWDNPTLVFNAVHQQKIAHATNIIGSDLVAFMYEYKSSDDLTIVESTINKGVYFAYVKGISGNDSMNYTLPSEEIKVSYEISSRQLTQTLTKYDTTYNGNSLLGARLVLSGFPTVSEVNKFSHTNLSYITSADDIVVGNVTTNSKTFNVVAQDAGNYSFTLIGSNNENYTIVNSSASFIISPLTATINWPTAQYIYDGNTKYFAATIANAVPGDVIDITYFYQGSSYIGDNLTSTSMKDAGEYTVTILSLSNPNYTIEGLSTDPAHQILAKNFVINKKPITITYVNSSFVYNGDYQGIRLSISGFITSDSSLFSSNPLVYTHTGDSNIYSNYALNLSAVNSGAYNIAVSGLSSNFDNSNYYLAETSKINIIYNIDQSTISFAWGNNSLIYNGTSQKIEATILESSIHTNVLTNTIDSISLQFTNNIYKDAGNYTASVIEIVGEDAGNYILPSITSKAWVISKRALSLNWSTTNTFIYNGKYHQVSLRVGNMINSDVLLLDEDSFNKTSFSMSFHSINKGTTYIDLNFKQINAGTYYYQLSSISNLNYTFSSITNKMTIDPLTAELDWEDILTFEYDGNTHAINANLTNQQLREDTGQIDLVTLTLINNSKVAAGTYQAEVVSISNSNYVLPTNRSIDWMIQKVQLNTSWIGNSSIEYDGLEHTISLQISGFRNDDHLAVNINEFITSRSISNLRTVGEYLYVDFKVITADTYNFVITEFSNPNYVFNSTETTMTIDRIDLSANWDGNAIYTYDGTNKNIKITLSGFINSDENNVTLSRLTYSFREGTNDISPSISRENGKLNLNFELRNAGTYLFTISAISGNYILPTSFNRTITISPSQLSYTWSSTDLFTYNGENQGMTLTISGIDSSDLSSFENHLLVTGNTFVTTTIIGNSLQYNFLQKNAGSYNISVNKLSTLKNYYFTPQSNTFVINPKMLTSTWSNDNIFIYNGHNQGMTLTISGLISSDLPTFSSNLVSTGGSSYTTTYSDNLLQYNIYGQDAGTYVISVSHLQSLINYTFLEQINTFTIQKKQLSSSWSTSTGNSVDVYNGEIKTITLTITGFQNGETFVSNQFTSNRLISTYDNSVDGIIKLAYRVHLVDDYQFSLLSFEDSNYQLDSTSFNYTIEQSDLTVQFSNNQNTEYSGTQINRVITITGLTTEDLNDLDLVNLNYSISSNVSVNIIKSDGDLIISYGATQVGLYEFFMNSFPNSNYTDFIIDDHLNVIPKQIEISLESSIISSMDEFHLTFTGLLGDDVVNSNDYTIQFYDMFDDIVDPNQPGTYYFIVSLDSERYTLSNTYMEFNEFEITAS